MELINLKGVGKATINHLNGLGIYDVEDLVRYYPYKFNILKNMDINNKLYHDNLCVSATVMSVPVVGFIKRNFNRLSFLCDIQGIFVKVTIFNRAFMKNNITIGKKITIIGKYDYKKQSLTASNILFKDIERKDEIIPVYHASKGITSSQINAIIKNSFSYIDLNNNLPDIIKEKYGFLNEDSSIRIIHDPKDEKELKNAIRTLKYEEIFTYMKKIKELKKKNEEHNSLYEKDIDIKKVNNFIEKLPFCLTKDQIKVVNEMLDNIKSDVKMNRLLQGDVGSGKTIVALILAYACFTAGYQTAFMAPTEILAIQHYTNALEIFKDTDLKVGILTGKTTKKQKTSIYEQLEKKEIDLIIGTHSLINDELNCNNLGLVITDEQHRFGVMQRLKLKNKAISPDVLMMSATPIPRTYALTIYGDTDVSSIKTVPKGRIPIITKVKKTDELKDVLEKIYEELKSNHQIYVISPMIEENDDTNYTNVYDLKHKFELAFKNYNIEILHGKLKKDEKDKIMDDYLNNKINILISTTVVEVGVDVKNSTVMVIFDADRFGLSQLHQLRGRVGRNSLQSYCFLISDKDKKRLKIMEEENDGYKISEEDFKLRGQGDIFGNKQSGALSFKLSDIRKDFELMVKVKSDVDEFL